MYGRANGQMGVIDRRIDRRQVYCEQQVIEGEEKIQSCQGRV
jgi:hypothetical protein